VALSLQEVQIRPHKKKQERKAVHSGGLKREKGKRPVPAGNKKKESQKKKETKSSFKWKKNHESARTKRPATKSHGKGGGKPQIRNKLAMKKKGVGVGPKGGRGTYIAGSREKTSRTSI